VWLGSVKPQFKGHSSMISLYSSRGKYEVSRDRKDCKNGPTSALSCCNCGSVRAGQGLPLRRRLLLQRKPLPNTMSQKSQSFAGTRLNHRNLHSRLRVIALPSLQRSLNLIYVV